MLARLFTTKQSGDSAERVAERYLGEQGLKLVARNYRCRYGEIDLVMREQDTLVFVEVRMRRTRADRDFGGAAASIGPHKQARIIAAAQHYLAGMKQLPPCRFDAVLLNQLSAARIEWIRDAFGA
ncbi:MAG: YraN family protein [Betaproteobacteria bacterium]